MTIDEHYIMGYVDKINTIINLCIRRGLINDYGIMSWWCHENAWADSDWPLPLLTYAIKRIIQQTNDSRRLYSWTKAADEFKVWKYSSD